LKYKSSFFIIQPNELKSQKEIKTPFGFLTFLSFLSSLGLDELAIRNFGYTTM
jgi:hypothetical protein